MSLNSIQLHLKGVLDGLELPVSMGGDRLTAIITPPVLDPRTGPRAYIWGSTGKEDRLAGSRRVGSGGRKEITYRPDIHLLCFSSTKDAGIGAQDSPFPATIGAVLSALRFAEMPVLGLKDEMDGSVSDIMSIGEQTTWDYAPLEATTMQGVYAFRARIRPTIIETLAG
jgi:hypothetical protein